MDQPPEPRALEASGVVTADEPYATTVLPEARSVKKQVPTVIGSTGSAGGAEKLMNILVFRA